MAQSSKFLPWLATTGLAAALLVSQPQQSDQNSPIQTAKALSDAYQELARTVGPAVVQVTAYRKVGSRRRRLQDGSGVIVRESGIVITNHHVVDNAEEVTITLTDGRRVEASVLGRDRDADLALLQAQEGNLSAVSLCDGREPAVGEIVLAIGNPLGLGHSVTVGIVSGVGRTDLNIAFYENFIQTDAQINAGNSGGPLINLSGEVIGINTAVAITAEDNGIAFAIPSKMVRRTVEDILEHGSVQRGFLGVENLSYYRAGRFLEEARSNGFEGVSRIVVGRVERGTPAEEAGLKDDDVIVEIASNRITDARSFRTAIAEVKPGKATTIKVWRDGKDLVLPVTMALRD